MSLTLKIKEHEVISTIFLTLAAICYKLNDGLMCFTVSLNLNAKQSREYMQEGGRKFEATGSTPFHNTMWNKVGSDGTS